MRVSHSKKHPWNQSIIVIHGCRGESKLKMGLPAITVLLWHASQDFTIGRITGRKFWRKSTVKIAQYARNRGSIFFQRRERSFYPGKTSFAIDETLRSIYIALFFSFLFFLFTKKNCIFLDDVLFPPLRFLKNETKKETILQIFIDFQEKSYQDTKYICKNKYLEDFLNLKKKIS